MKLTKTVLRNIIREEIQKTNKRIKMESVPQSLNVKELRNHPSDTWNDTYIKLVLDRKVSSKAAVYRLETDNWFRRFENPGKGYGVMIRKLKISNTPIRLPNSWLVGPNQVVLRALITYWPNPGGMDWEMADDVPANWETAQGFIILGTKNFTGFEILSTLNPKQIEHFVNTQTGRYIP
jgi:hypothetical protein